MSNDKLVSDFKTAFGRPTMPVEFLTLQASEPLCLCSICWSVVPQDKVQPHADWHAGERLRNSLNL